MRYLFSVITLLFIPFLLAACGNAPVQAEQQGQAPIIEVTPAPSVPMPEQQAQEPVSPKIPEPVLSVPSEPTSPQPVSPSPKAPKTAESVADLLAIFKEKVKNYQYNFGDVNSLVFGDRVRVDLGRFIRPDGDNAANIIYLDRSASTAVAYCEGASAKRVCDRTQQGPFAVSYADYHQKLPTDWLQEFSNAEVRKVTKEAQTLNHVQTDLWELTASGKEVKMWVIPNFAMPIRIEIDSEKEQYDFTEMSVNTVQEEAMVPNPDVRTDV